MELRHIYKLSEEIGNLFNSDEMIGANSDDILVEVNLTPQTLYAIDKEFYRMTHNGETEGFNHSDVIEAKIGNINFLLKHKKANG